MQLPVLTSVEDVAAHQLCCGCGACAAVDPARYEMVDAAGLGRRPQVRAHAPAPDRDTALRVCPGIALEHDRARFSADIIDALLPAWGPVLEVWEGYAADDGVRHKASSGGAATALAIACMTEAAMHGTLHIRSRPDAPLLNETVLSTTVGEVIDACGSRYAPASPCDGLGLIENAPSPCVFIGKPCDVAALRKAAAQRPGLDARVGVAIAIFCAGTPTTEATLALTRALDVEDPRDVVDVRYRGHGWPGPTSVTVRTPDGLDTRTMPYERAWGEILTRHKQWRCHICPDHTGEFADIAVGDPWHRPRGEGEPGRSLVVVRTERGRQIVRMAMERGHLTLERTDPASLGHAQPELLRTRASVWGRLLACRLAGVPVPRFRGMSVGRHWWSGLSVGAKVRSVLGTFRRIRSRGLRRRVAVRPIESVHPHSTNEHVPAHRRAA